MIDKKRKKFRETRVGQFLLGKDGGLVDTIGDILPDSGFLGVFKRLLDNNDNITPQDRQHALELLKIDIEELKSVENKWKYDMQSDSWLSKSARPLTLMYLILSTTIFVILDSVSWGINIDQSWISLTENVLMVVIVSYFGGRSIEKYKKIK